MTKVQDYVEARAPDVSEGSSKSALEIARMRFANGEITAEEFDEIRKRLQEQGLVCANVSVPRVRRCTALVCVGDKF